MTYAVVTPVRDDAPRLARLAACLGAQTLPPSSWEIIDTGSSDGTAELAASLAREHPWIRVARLPRFAERERGAPVVLALEKGIDSALESGVDVIVKVDADVTLGEGFFAALVGEFRRNPRLGMASGVRLEKTSTGWQRQNVTSWSVEAQCRAYRRACLKAVRPFEQRKGWDGIDEVKAVTRGWQVAVLEDLRFKHHRRIGACERSRLAAWWQDGGAAHFMGYRHSYVVLRAAFHARRDPAAVALVAGYLWSFLRRRPRVADAGVRSFLRRKQALRRLPSRAREALGRPRPPGRRDVVLVADGGGHLVELVSLQEVWARFSRVWVTVDGPGVGIVPAGEEVFLVRGSTQRSPARLIRNAWLAMRLLRRFRPAAVLTTGAGLAVPFAWAGRLLGARVIYVECAGRVGVSLSCRLVAPVAACVYVQWPDAAASLRGARYAGPPPFVPG